MKKNTPPADAIQTQEQEHPEAAAVPVIGEEQVREAARILQEYKDGKSSLDARIVENEEWWKLRHWEVMRHSSGRDEPTPTSAWLFNVIANKHADAMDNYPSANMLPREASDRQEAQMLSSVVPVIMEKNDFEAVYDEAWWYKLKQGCAVYAVRWVPDRCGGIGDVAYECVDLLNLFWEPGVKDIQRSRNLFCVTLTPNEVLEERWPQLAGKLSSASELSKARYRYDDTVPTEEKSLLIDWYYRKRNADGRTVLHYCQFVNDEVLFATENDPAYAQRGFYDHGEYPFEFDVLYPMADTPVGIGFIDICRDPQAYIDMLDQAVLENALDAATPRYFLRRDCAVNREQLADRRQKYIECDGNLGDDSVRVVETKPLSGHVRDVISAKVEELKETSGNRDVNTGGSTSGATAAAAIAAMQEAGSKLSRDMIGRSYRVYRRIVFKTIELIRQFYTVSRSFRITGAQTGEQFVQFGNDGLVPQAQGMAFGQNMGYRVPVFDIKVTAEKASPYSRMSQNELALQLYQLGFFNPQMADQALTALNMMDFDGREDVLRQVQTNGTLLQTVVALQEQVLKLSGIVDRMSGSNLLGAAAAGIDGTGGQQPPAPAGGGLVELDGASGAQKGAQTRVEKVRQEAAERSTPR